MVMEEKKGFGMWHPGFCKQRKLFSQPPTVLECLARGKQNPLHTWNKTKIPLVVVMNIQRGLGIQALEANWIKLGAPRCCWQMQNIQINPCQCIVIGNVGYLGEQQIHLCLPNKLHSFSTSQIVMSLKLCSSIFPPEVTKLIHSLGAEFVHNTRMVW